MRQPRKPRFLAWPAAFAAAVLCGCGGSGPAAAPSAPPPVLPAAAVSYLPSTARPLTARDLVHESTAPGLAAGLARWGYVTGAQRLFQGQSKTLQVALVGVASAGRRVSWLEVNGPTASADVLSRLLRRAP
jgi:hypothetical protein